MAENDEVIPDEINQLVTAPKVEEEENRSNGDSKDVDMSSQNETPSQKSEEEIIEKKYGGLLPKKPPLISKDNERAFFDSADWALGKVGAQKSKGPLEALRPKLEPSPHHHARSRSAYARGGESEDGCKSVDSKPGFDHQDGQVDDNKIESHEYSPEIQNLQN